MTDTLIILKNRIFMLIDRNSYTERIVKFSGTGLIKVITGQRRSGKSSILKLLVQKFQSTSEKTNIIFIDKELNEFEFLRDGKALHKYIRQNLKSRGRNIICIDEVQEIRDFENPLREFAASGSADIYITGSNATMLSGDLATRLSGRYIEFNVKPLGYSEFLRFHKLPNNDDILHLYLRFGGMPYLVNISLEDEIVNQYLRSIFDTILLKDIIKRFNIRNVDFLYRLAAFLADNTGQLVSANRISSFIKSQKIDVTANMTLDYLRYLTQSYFIHRVQRMDLAGKKIFEVNEKYYFDDLGLRNMLVGYKPGDISKLIENAVYHHLAFLGFRIYVGKIGELEIDFTAEKNNKTVYIQSAYLLPDDKVVKREFGNLLKIDDNFNKYVVSLDPAGGGNYKGIRHLHLREFLMMNDI